MVYTFTLSRRSLPVRCLCVLLCLLVLWCFFMLPRAGAVVAEAELAYWGGAIVVSVLAAGGMALATGDAQKVGSAMWTALKDTGGKAWDSIQAMAAWAASAGSRVKDAAFRVGKDVWDAIISCFEANKSSFEAVSTLVVTGEELGSEALKKKFYAINDLYLQTISVDDHVYTYGGEPSGTVKILRDGDVIFSKDNPLSSAPFYGDAFGRFTLYYSTFDHKPYLYASIVGHLYNGTVLTSDVFSLQLSVPFTVSVGVPIDFGDYDLVYPSDDYLVKAPDLPAVDIATGAVSWPSDAVYDKDAVAIPYPIDAAGEKVADIPYDAPVDQTTGKDIADAGSDVDTPSKPGEGEGTETGTTAGLIGTIISLLKNFFDSPSDFKLNMDGFRNLAIADKFPFCIPFDMVDSVKQFAASGADYQFRIKLDTQYFQIDHTVDLSAIALPLAFFRYIVVVWFVWVLMSRTHDLMKW